MKSLLVFLFIGLSFVSKATDHFAASANEANEMLKTAKFIVRPGISQVVPAAALAVAGGVSTGLYDRFKKKPSIAVRAKKAATGAVKAFKSTK